MSRLLVLVTIFLSLALGSAAQAQIRQDPCDTTDLHTSLPSLSVNNNDALCTDQQITVTNASVGANGAAAPASSTQVGAKDASGNTQPASPANPLPVTDCPGCVNETGNATGTTGAVVGTLAAAAQTKAHICGFSVSAIGGTAALGPVTVAGLVGSSMVFQFSSSAAGVTVSQTFTPCVPASAVNTPITVTTTADGTAAAVDVNSWGFQK